LWEGERGWHDILAANALPERLILRRIKIEDLEIDYLKTICAYISLGKSLCKPRYTSV
jgi:hypothetical protein